MNNAHFVWNVELRCQIEVDEHPYRRTACFLLGKLEICSTREAEKEKFLIANVGTIRRKQMSHR